MLCETKAGCFKTHCSRDFLHPNAKNTKCNYLNPYDPGPARRTRNPAVPSSSRKHRRGTTSLDMFIRVYKSVGFAYLLPFSQLIITHDLILTKFLRILFMRWRQKVMTSSALMYSLASYWAPPQKINFIPILLDLVYTPLLLLKTTTAFQSFDSDNINRWSLDAISKKRSIQFPIRKPDTTSNRSPQAPRQLAPRKTIQFIQFLFWLARKYAHCVLFNVKSSSQ